MQPGQGRASVHPRQPLVDRIVRADEEISARFGELVDGGPHQFPDPGARVPFEALRVPGERVGVQRDFGMIERSQQLRAFQTHSQVAKPRALGGAGDDSDVPRHAAILPRLMLAGLWAAGSVAGQPHERLRYPTAERGSVVEQYHGTAVADPYRWLEDLDSPATRAWVGAEASLTQTYLEALPQRARLRARLAALYDFEKRGIPFREGGRYFYTDNSGQQDQSVLLTATRLGDAAAVGGEPHHPPRAGDPGGTGYGPHRARTPPA